MPALLFETSYTVGDFVKVYQYKTRMMFSAAREEQEEEEAGIKNYYNAVVTCFFLDTATNVYEYVAAIASLLEARASGSTTRDNGSGGGIWINVGPLQWHRNALLQVSANELRDILVLMGFDILHWSVDAEPVEYRNAAAVPGAAVAGGSIPRSTQYHAYHPLRFVARKKRA